MRARYVPSIQKHHFRPWVHEWPDKRFNDGNTLKNLCGSITTVVDRVVETEDAVTCLACLSAASKDQEPKS